MLLCITPSAAKFLALSSVQILLWGPQTNMGTLMFLAVVAHLIIDVQKGRVLSGPVPNATPGVSTHTNAKDPASSRS